MDQSCSISCSSPSTTEIESPPNMHSQSDNDPGPSKPIIYGDEDDIGNTDVEPQTEIPAPCIDSSLEESSSNPLKRGLSVDRENNDGIVSKKACIDPANIDLSINIQNENSKQRLEKSDQEGNMKYSIFNNNEDRKDVKVDKPLEDQRSELVREKKVEDETDVINYYESDGSDNELLREAEARVSYGINDNYIPFVSPVKSTIEPEEPSKISPVVRPEPMKSVPNEEPRRKPPMVHQRKRSVDLLRDKVHIHRHYRDLYTDDLITDYIEEQFRSEEFDREIEATMTDEQIIKDRLSFIVNSVCAQCERNQEEDVDWKSETKDQGLIKFEDALKSIEELVIKIELDKMDFDSNLDYDCFEEFQTKEQREEKSDLKRRLEKFAKERNRLIYGQGPSSSMNREEEDSMDEYGDKDTEEDDEEDNECKGVLYGGRGKMKYVYYYENENNEDDGEKVDDDEEMVEEVEEEEEEDEEAKKKIKEKRRRRFVRRRAPLSPIRSLSVDDKKLKELYENAAEGMPVVRKGDRVMTLPGEEMDEDAADRSRYYILLDPEDSHIKQVKTVYDKVSKRYQEYVNTVGLARWSRAFDSNDDRSPTVFCQNPVRFRVAPSHEEDFVARNSRTKDAGEYRCGRVVLPPLNVLPRLNYFTHIEHNMRVEDRRTLSHIPYIGEGDYDEIGFAKLLIEFYDEGIHGTRVTYGKVINDRILYEVMSTLMPKSQGNKHLRDLYNAAINDCFPNKCSARELINKYIQLKLRFEDSLRLPYSASSKTQSTFMEKYAVMFSKDIPFSPKSKIDPICTRCLRINCVVHLDEKHKISSVPPKTPKSSRPTCSFLCFYMFKERMAYQDKILSSMEDDEHTVRRLKCFPNCPADIRELKRIDDNKNSTKTSNVKKGEISESKEVKKEVEEDKNEGKTIKEASTEDDSMSSEDVTGAHKDQRSTYEEPMETNDGEGVSPEDVKEEDKGEGSEMSIDDEEDEDDNDNDSKKRKKKHKTYKFLVDKGPFDESAHKDIPPSDWRDPVLPSPFWNREEEDLARTLMNLRMSYCDVATVLKTKWMGQPEKMRECYQIQLYLERNNLLDAVEEPCENEPDLRDFTRQQQNATWRKQSISSERVKNAHRFVPCVHKGPCDENADPPCRCALLNTACTKHCNCFKSCKLRFPGCKCAPGKCRSKQCQCYFASWECDPDVCTTCLCDRDNTLDEVHGHIDGEDDEKGEENDIPCQNLCITMGKGKKTYVNKSGVAGWGLYMAEPCENGDLIAEYTGEIISTAESERRGHMYDKLKLSYTFKLNEDEVIDATRAGNLARFINHSKYPNCTARVYIVNGDHRIGIYARRDISEGEELFFNYGYSSSHLRSFTNKERTRDPTLCDDLVLTEEQGGCMKKKKDSKDKGKDNNEEHKVDDDDDSEEESVEDDEDEL